MLQQETNKSIVKKFNKEFIENGDSNVFASIIAPEFINQTAPQGVPKGPEGVKYFLNDFLKPAFPDLKVEIHDQFAEVCLKKNLILHSISGIKTGCMKLSENYLQNEITSVNRSPSPEFPLISFM